MIAVQKWGMFITDDNEEEEDTTCDNYEHKVWREGVLVTYDDGFFLVESFDDDVSCVSCLLFFKDIGRN